MKKESVKKCEKLFLKNVGIKNEGAVWRHAEGPRELKETTLQLNGVNTYCDYREVVCFVASEMGSKWTVAADSKKWIN
jgi:hypothetical protein